MITLLKKISITSFLLAASLQIALANETDVSIASDTYNLYDQNSTILSGGTNSNGDGDVVALGYYSAATSGNPFAGTWVALTGNGQPNNAAIPTAGENLNQTSIGDIFANGGTDGEFEITPLKFNPSSGSSNNNLPSAGQILSIRFYNGTTVANSTYYNAVSDSSLWLWTAPAASAVTINLDMGDTGVVFQSNVGVDDVNFTAETSISLVAVPEVSTVACALLCVGGLGLHAFRRRRVTA